MTRLVDFEKPIKKPFSSKLYMFVGLMLYFSTFSSNYIDGIISNIPGDSHTQRRRYMYVPYHRNIENDEYYSQPYAYDRWYANRRFSADLNIVV
jgi:hypothetical protein